MNVLLAMRLFITLTIFTATWLLLLPGSAHASTYYLSPNGSDSANGSSTTPWKTFDKANAAMSSGDTVIIKNGVYPAYFRITKSGTTWKAENKHQAILDGKYGPELLKGSWENIVKVFESICPHDEKGNNYSNGLSIGAKIDDKKPKEFIPSNNITVDGLFIRNSCGRGIGIAEKSQNITVKNSKTDWTMIAAMLVDNDATNTQIISNEFTRMSFNSKYLIEKSGKDYAGVNTSFQTRGNNTTIRDNIFAWGLGEVAIDKGSDQTLFENNLMVGNKNNLYVVRGRNLTVRNNLSYAPEGMYDFWLNKPAKGFGIRNESSKTPLPESENIAIYNNLFVNTSVGFDGGAMKDGERVSTSTKNIYFAHNTLVASKPNNENSKGEVEQQKLLTMSYNADQPGTGIFENNILDRRKDPTAKISGTNYKGITFRNNILPTDVESSIKGSNDIYANDPGMVNSIVEIKIDPPAVGIPQVDMNLLRTALNLNNYRLKQSSPAINAGFAQVPSVGGIPNNILRVAKEQDYFKVARIQPPDIGAMEYTGTNPPTPLPTSPTFTPIPVPSETTPPPTTGDIRTDYDADADTDWLDLFKWLPRFDQENRPNSDFNGNGKPDIFDFSLYLTRMFY